MKPSVGRIVTYRQGHIEAGATRKGTNGTVEHPAIITRVWSERCVNLQVFFDGHEVDDRQSILLDETGADNAASSWHWPVHVIDAEEASPDFTALVIKQGDSFVFRERRAPLSLSPGYMARFLHHLRRMLGTRGPVLMSGDNHDGWKLEDLCVQLVEEITAKNKRLIDRGLSDHVIATRVINNNASILVLLAQIKQCQENTAKALNELGPDRGPGGKSRI